MNVDFPPSALVPIRTFLSDAIAQLRNVGRQVLPLQHPALHQARERGVV